MAEINSMTKRALFLTLLIVTAISSWQVVAKIPAAGKIVLVTGKAVALSSDGKARKLKRGGPFYEGDTIETQRKSFVKLKYTDGGVMLLRPVTKLIVEKYKYPKDGVGKSVTNLVKGGLRAVTGAIAKRNRDNYKMKTPSATMGVRGTDFTVRFCNGDCTDLEDYGAPAPNNGLYTGVNKGAIVLTNTAGSQLYNVGQFGYIAGNKSKPRLLPSAPAIFIIDSLPDPTADNSNDFIEGSTCK